MSDTINLRRISFALALLSFGTLCHAYEVIDVSNGGSISGKISFTGTPPANPVHKITKDIDFCGTSIAADYYVVNGDGGIKNVVVSIENIESGKAYDPSGVIEFENKKCIFAPHVSVAVQGQKLGIVSRDSILHNTHLYHGKKLRTLYNIAIPFEDKVIKKKLKKAGKVTVKCDAHEWMLGYVYVATHPYATVSAVDGSFTLSDIPPGDYKIKIWHEKFGEVSRTISVSAGATATLDYSFSE